ncbi:hypothetical protein AWR38_04945 [Idiomarina sp. WRN-38]|nr:hypothetical protein AUR68_04930 [Idiomarina sp. H105]OAE90768.1 hypothetical protein AWR38_04945 [Idiomarina sp. WRN-38]
MVRESWEQFTLGQFMDFKNGLNTDKSQYGSGIKFVNVMDVFDNDFLTQEVIVGRVQVPEQKLQENLLQYGDILFNRTSETFDEIAMSSTYLDDAPATFGGFVIRARDRKNKLLPNFSVYAFQSNLFRQQVIRLGQGAVRANIGQKDLSKVRLPVPPKTEQKKIAQILSTWDKAITTTEQLLVNSQQQKKALMQQLLTGKKRLLDDNGVRFSGEWQESLLGELATITTGSSNRQDSSLTGEYTFFDRSIDVRTSNNYLFDAEAIIVPGEGQQFTPKYFSGKFDLHQRTYAIMDFPSCSGKFLYYYLSHYKQYLLSQAVGSTVKSLRLPMFKKMKLNIPPIDEQHKIAKVLSNADLDCNLLIGKLEHLKKEKKALMQQLLTGKRRVKVDEEAA